MPSVQKTAHARQQRRRRTRRVSAISIQVHFLVARPPGYTVTAKFLREVFDQWIKTGETPERIQVVYIDWKSGKKEGSYEHPEENEIEEARERLQAVMQAADKNIKPGLRDHLHLRALVS